MKIDILFLFDNDLERKRCIWGKKERLELEKKKKKEKKKEKKVNTTQSNPSPFLPLLSPSLSPLPTTLLSNTPEMKTKPPISSTLLCHKIPPPQQMATHHILSFPPLLLPLQIAVLLLWQGLRLHLGFLLLQNRLLVGRGHRNRIEPGFLSILL